MKTAHPGDGPNSRRSGKTPSLASSGGRAKPAVSDLSAESDDPPDGAAGPGALASGTTAEEAAARPPGTATADGDWLVSAIEGEIIPRLLVAHSVAKDRALRDRHGGETVDDGTEVVQEEVREFARILLAHEDDVALAFIDSLCDRGVDLEFIYLDLLAPAARLLGEGWDDDRISFTDVTIGLTRLHRLLRTVGRDFGSAAETELRTERQALFAPAPHEQHTFGLLMVADFFRRAGWGVWDEPSASRERLESLVAESAYDMVGLSVSCDVWLEEVRAAIAMIRERSANPSVVILLGGQAVTDHPDLAEHVGADGAVGHAREAVARAEALMNTVPGQPRDG